MKHRIGSAALAAALAGVLAGCAGREPTSTVTGKVTINQQVIPAGQVTITSADLKHSVVGVIRDDGSYTVANAPVGKAKVSIVAPPPRKGSQPPKIMESSGRTAPVPVPVRYCSVGTTDLVVDVTSTPVAYDINLKAR